MSATYPSSRPRLARASGCPQLIRRALALALVLGLGSATSGCAKKPTMHLNHAEINGVRIAFPPSVGVIMTTVVDVHNPNSYDVAIRAMRGQIVLAQRYTMPIDFRATGEGVWLPADATTSVRVPVTMPIDLALALLRESFTSPTIPFRVTGSADVTATRTFKIEGDDYSVDEQGSFSRDQLQLAVQGLGLRF